MNENKKINYQNKLDEITQKIKIQQKQPNLLLQCCCGPCSSYVVEYLIKYFNITAFYYNPNTYPEEEYNLRLKQLEKFSNLSGYNFKIINANYKPEEFYNKIKGLESEPEGQNRCKACIRLRLEKTAKLAKKLGFDYFTTTLSVSPHKNADFINKCGEHLEEKYKINYLFADFKKREGYKRSIELSKKYGLYRQNYCGCEFSLNKANRNSTGECP